jgi:hypothetical protein
MNIGLKRLVHYVLGAAIACLIAIPQAHGQAADPAAEPKPLMAEDVFKNVQLLRGIPVKEFLGTMGFFSAATGMNCIDCHEPQGEGLEAYALDTPLKQTARKMIVMVNALNRANFDGQRKVTCYTCHRASERPEPIPSLADQYSVPEDDPNRVEIITDATQRPVNQPSAAQILDKYATALGGATPLARITSITAKGSYEGYDTLHEKVPVDIFANAPNQLNTVVHTQHGDSVATFDGTHGWLAAADKLMRVLPLMGGDLQGAKMDAALFFPARLKQDFQWRTGFPLTSIDDHPVQVIQDAVGGNLGIKLYFDAQSGLLLRLVRFTETAVGVIPAQVDYSDYRVVAGTGVKIPFKRVVTWTDDRQTYELSNVQPNARIDAAKFATPAPPKEKP